MDILTQSDELKHTVVYVLVFEGRMMAGLIKNLKILKMISNPSAFSWLFKLQITLTVNKTYLIVVDDTYIRAYWNGIHAVSISRLIHYQLALQFLRDIIPSVKLKEFLPGKSS
jgi:hypothetical protein